MKTKKLFAILLTFAMTMGAFSLQQAKASSTVTVTVHYHNDNGNYAETVIDVWNFSDTAAEAGTVAIDEYGWKNTFTVNGVNEKEYVKFRITSDSVFPTDVRYLDPAGSSSIEVWLIDGDAKAYGQPVKIDPQYTTAKDGVRYVAVQAIPLYFNTGNVNNYTITYGASNGYYTPGTESGSGVAANLGGTPPSPKVTLLRNLNRFRANQQDDWWEICPASKSVLVNYSTTTQTAEMTTGSHAAANNGLGFNLREGDVYPLFLGLDLIQEGPVSAEGKTFLSLKSIRGMTQTLGGIIAGADTYLLPNMFVGYEKVLDFTSNPEAVGFSGEMLKAFKQFIDLEAQSTDGMPIACSITLDGKKVFSYAAGTVAQFRTTPNGSGGYNAAIPIPVSEQVPVTADSLFDLASNSKMYSGIYAMERLVSQGLLDLDKKLNEYPGWENYKDSYIVYTGKMSGSNYVGKTGKDNTTIRQILSHYAGLEADPEYQNRIQAGELWYHTDNPYDRTEIIDMICKTPLRYNVGTTYNYSDVDFMIVALLAESITGVPFDVYMEQIYKEELGVQNTAFNPLLKGYDQDQLVATCEINGNTRDGNVMYGFMDDGYTPVPERSYTIQGEVHDEKAYYAMGGISGHAGLFSSVNDMSELMQLALNCGSYNGFNMFDRQTHQMFTTPFTTTATVGLGWWMNNTSGSIMSYFSWGPSMQTYGHQGWTGTISVIDPLKGMSVTCLTSMKHGPTINAANTFTNTQARIGGNGEYSGPGNLVLQNCYAQGSMDFIEHDTVLWGVSYNPLPGRDLKVELVLDGNYATGTKPAGEPGYVFDGWYKDEAFTQPWNFDTDKVMCDVSLYSKWVEAENVPAEPTETTWKVRFVRTGIATQIVADGDTATPVADPARAGYKFGGWFTNADCTAVWDFATPVTSNINLYAKWTELHTITFDTNGGSIVRPLQVADGEYAAGARYSPSKVSSISIPDSLPFLGWFTDSEMTTPWVPSAEPVTEDMTVYAKWGIRNYYVKFERRGGSGTIPNQSVTYGGTATQPTVTPTKANSVFEGWYTNAGLLTPYNFSAPITANTVIYAKFTTDLGNTTVPLKAPEYNQTPQPKVAGVGYTGDVEWFNVTDNVPLSGTFEAAKVYRATVTLDSCAYPPQTPLSFYRWPTTAPAVTVAGQTVQNTQVSGGYVTGNKLTFTVDFAPIPDELVSIGTIDPISVPNNRVTLEQAKAMLGNTVSIVTEKGSADTAEVVWNADTVPAYDMTVAGVYELTGTVTLPHEVTNPNGVSLTVVTTVTVEDPIYATKVTVSAPALMNLKKGTTVNVAATVEPADVSYPGVVWVSSNPLIATVDSQGNVKGITAGTVIITVTSTDGKAKCVFAVKVTN